MRMKTTQNGIFSVANKPINHVKRNLIKSRDSIKKKLKYISVEG